MFERFSDEILAAFSTREGGVSEGCYASLNLAHNTGDDPARVRINFERWCESLGVDPHHTVMVHQVHGNRVIEAEASLLGEGIYRERSVDADGIVTNQPGIALITSHADCAPLYLYDSVHHAVGMTHAGWRGTVAEIARETVKKMAACYGTKPQDVYAAVGPCIHAAAFACDADVAEPASAMPCLSELPAHFREEAIYYRASEGKYHVSLPLLNRASLIAAGVPEPHIEIDPRCTYEREDLYFSHRRMGKARGGHCALLMLRGEGR